MSDLPFLSSSSTPASSAPNQAISECLKVASMSVAFIVLREPRSLRFLQTIIIKRFGCALTEIPTVWGFTPTGSLDRFGAHMS